MTAVRYFARDAGVGYESYAPDIVAAQREVAQSGYAPETVIDENGNVVNGGDPSDDGPIPFGKEAAPGLGAWNDFSPVAEAARRALGDAAGISVPERSFIVWVVVGYLCVLVPANWIVFRFLGRVEWAWIAAPLIAIACTVVVIQQAQLNIGFARSRNEIAVVEMQAGYSRAHVARYTAIYTSLATRYEFRLDDPGGQILPFPHVSEPAAFKLDDRWQTPGELVCRRADDTRLTGFSIGSNVTDFVHSEEMADFGGTVALHQDSDGVLRVTNGTKYAIDDCQALRGKSGVADLATIGRLEPGGTAALKFNPHDFRGNAGAGHQPQASDPSGELGIQGIVEVALEQQKLRPEEVCLLARIVDEVPGLTVTPVAGQTRQAAILVAHLDAGRLPDPARDRKPRSSDPADPNRNADDPNPGAK